MDTTVEELINSGTASTSGRRQYVTALFDAVRSPAGSKYRSKLEAALPRMHLLMDELREDVAPSFPKFAEAAIASRIKRVALKTNPSRRLIEVDVGALIAKDPEVQLTTSEAAPFAVEIDELEYREQENGPSTRTVTVGYYEADIMYAVLFMPKNASFLFDVAEREQRIDWGYEIKVKGPKGERSRIVRDNQSNSSHQCVNARIVNVFGGVSSPSGWPNSQTASFCSGNGQPKTLQEVRGEVMQKVAGVVAELLALAQ